MRRTLAALALALLPAVAPAAQRFAVVVGNDRGDAARPRLWYAEKDADRMHRALRELGEFDEGATVLLRGRSPAALVEALRGLEPRIGAAKARGERTLLLVYYSGHAGPGGLEMGAERLPFDELRALVGASGADARVAIVDACEAGLLTQVKGAAAAPALAFPLPQDDLVAGTAFIASTAVGEAAQESAALGGSFFTHHLEVALRGAGDSDADGRVTLGEAFGYTSARTRAGTAATVAGTQHPTYELKMSGRGDVVLTELRRAVARLVLPPDPGATLVLRGPAGIFAEVPGAASEVVLAMPAGPYRVERRAREGRAVGELELVEGRTTSLPRLEPTRYELARSKGGPRPGLLYTGVGLYSVGLPGFGVAPTFRVGLRKELGPIGLRLRLDHAQRRVEDRWLQYDYAYTGGALAALYPLNAGRILVEAGLEAGYGWASQRLVEAGRRSFGSAALSAGGALMVTAPVGPLRVGLDATLGGQTFSLNDDRAFKLAASVAALALYGF